MEKRFLTYEQQLDHLIRDKHLRISDRAYAESMLKKIGYFSLIGGYKTLLKNPTTGKFADGVAFEDIVALYRFDESLRALFLQYILMIEQHMSSLISYYFTEKFGEAQAQYLNPSHYNGQRQYHSRIAQLVAKLDGLANENDDYPYICHMRRVYGNVPLWVLINAITLGTLSKFYEYTLPDIQTKISKNFPSVNEKQLAQFLHVLTKFRNVCAHNERLFSFQTRNDIPDMCIHEELGIPKKGAHYVCGKHDLFAVVIAFRYLLSDAEFREFLKHFQEMLDHCFASSSAIPKSVLFCQMGFPEQWKAIFP